MVVVGVFVAVVDFSLWVLFFFFFFWCVVAMVVVDLSLIFGENHIFRRFSLWSLSFTTFGPYLWVSFVLDSQCWVVCVCVCVCVLDAKNVGTKMWFSPWFFMLCFCGGGLFVLSFCIAVVVVDYLISLIFFFFFCVFVGFLWQRWWWWVFLALVVVGFLWRK